MHRSAHTGARHPARPTGALLGRDGLVDELVGAAGHAAQGTGSVFVLAGEAGIGKTSVARALAQLVRGALVVSWGRCSADRSKPPYWPWRPVISPEPDQDAGRDAHAAIGSRRLEHLNVLHGRLVDRARAGPLLHVIEDLQWADVASVLLLARVSTTVVDMPLMVVATLRTGEPASPRLDEAIEYVRQGTQVRSLAPLGDAEVEALIRAAGITPDAGLTGLVRTRTGGNPLYVTELLRSVEAKGVPARVRDSVAGNVPERVGELIAHRLARLPAPVADMVVTAAVVGTEGAIDALAAAHHVGVAPVVELLEQARAARLLDAAPPGRWRFRHDLVRDAIYGAAPDSTRSRRHGAVLEALARDASTPMPALAHHALAALPLFDADRAVALAAAAGESALGQHAYEEAVAWFDRALAAAPAGTAPRWRAELLVSCAEARRHVGDSDLARRDFLTAAELTDDAALLARAALGYADPGADLGIAWRTDDPTTGSLLERAIAAQPAGDSVTTVLLRARLAAEWYFSDEPGRAKGLADAAVAMAQRLGDPRGLVAAGAVAHDAFTVGQADLAEQLRGSQQLLEWARASGSVAALLSAHRARVFDLLGAGDLAAMDAEVVAFSRIADPLRAPGYQWWPALWSAMRAALEGRHDDAEAKALVAYEAGARPFPPLALLNLAFLLFFLRREQGRLAEVEQPTRDWVASHADIPALRVGLAFLLAERGNLDDARGALAAIDEATLDRLRDRNWPASWFQLARACFLVGDQALAARLCGDRHPTERCVMVSLATTCLGAADLARGWLLHCVGDLDGADGHYTAAEATNAAIGARSWLAQARVDHARLLVERGRPGDLDEARRLAALASAAARAIGLAPVTTALADLADRMGGGHDAVGAAAVEARDGGVARGSFRRDGTTWEVVFAGHGARVPHARGMSDIAYLLAHQSQGVPAVALVHEPGSVLPADRGASALDERARRAVGARLRALDAEIAEAEAHGDGERAALAREELQLLAEAVARDVGIGGRARRVGDDTERARKTVSTRIRRAIAQVGAAHPELGRHLERSIDTGRWCAYRPAEPVDWST